MRPTKVFYWAALLAGIVPLTGTAAKEIAAQGPAALVMVVSKEGNSLDSISKGDAKKLLLGLTNTWSNGQKVVVVLRPQQSGERAQVLQKICGMTEAEYTRYEMQVMFTGHTAAKVQEAPTAAAVKSFVKANPGAVGFLHEADLDKELKVLLTVE
jgi:ABC-type phosphate transport system substrate-binding protein